MNTTKTRKKNYWRKKSLLTNPIFHKVIGPFLEDSRKGFVLNIALLGLLVAIFTYLFFFLYLPSTTYHGETLIVPDARGMNMKELTQMVYKRDLRYQIIDSAYTNELPPNVVISQSPMPNTEAKVNRTIYVVINSGEAPKRSLPNIIDSSLRNARQRLESYGFQVGNVKYVPYREANRVLKLSVAGIPYTKSELEAGVLCAKSQPIDLEVGDGVGKTTLIMPNLVGIPLDEAEIYLLGLNLQIDRLRWIVSNETFGVVINQRPLPGSEIKLNAGVDLWVASE